MKNGIRPRLLTVASGDQLHVDFAREGVQAGTGFRGQISGACGLTLRVSGNELLFFVHVEQ
jgi:hypothetical protein